MPTPTGPALMEKLVSLCKRRGFIFQSSEIYGGINGFWDYGPLGVELKNNLRDVWWESMVRNPPPGPDGEELQIVGLDCSIISHPRVWEASGHVGGFNDPMQTCRQCKKLFRADHVWEGLLESEWARAPRRVPGRHAGLPAHARRRRHPLVRVAREEAREGARDRAQPERREATA